MNEINPKGDKQRNKFRKLGKIILAIGLLCIATSITESIVGQGMPKLGWLSFIGIPLTFVGSVLLQFGYMGAAARFMAGETMPVAKDSINYLGKNTTEGVEAFSKAAFSGLKEATKEELPVEERLEKLKELLDKGLIDKDDYEQQQERILKDL